MENKAVKSFLKGVKARYSHFKKHGFFGERTFDPVYNCDVYKKVGCAHVDGPLCDMKTCNLSLKEDKKCI